jgi:hypothetical protein
MFRFRRKSAEQIRLETLSEVGRRLHAFAVAEFDRTDVRPHPRGAAFWDAGCYVVETLGDGDWRCSGEGGRNEFIEEWTPLDKEAAEVWLADQATR